MIADPRYWRAVAIVCGHPAWVWKMGFTPVAQQITALLAIKPQTIEQLAQQMSYDDETISIALRAMARLGMAEQVVKQWRRNCLWRLKGEHVWITVSRSTSPLNAGTGTGCLLSTTPPVGS